MLFVLAVYAVPFAHSIVSCRIVYSLFFTTIIMYGASIFCDKHPSEDAFSVVLLKIAFWKGFKVIFSIS